MGKGFLHCSKIQKLNSRIFFTLKTHNALHSSPAFLVYVMFIFVYPTLFSKNHRSYFYHISEKMLRKRASWFLFNKSKLVSLAGSLSFVVLWKMTIRQTTNWSLQGFFFPMLARELHGVLKRCLLYLQKWSNKDQWDSCKCHHINKESLSLLPLYKITQL